MSYQLCPTCKRPLINKGNLKILRKKWIKWGVGGLIMTAICGVAAASVLPLLGFGSAGVTAGSFAASWQGPAVAAGSVFAICQSLGATGLGILLFGAVGSVAGGAGALGLIYKYREKFEWCCCDAISN
ncbi:interferon alpha-inducible protein 27-like protein 2B [Leguminivora glycinivorella]|uniref:interferon alpha-inducible protein 27-like protein 2B n=1 Tax=Leguminivora glycinivorella TaxID=1035111 RepID=UPI00200F91C8|nr:interferon alpha-inducible protein 27-like protein 2B [Leguminivora glycinivorella]